MSSLNTLSTSKTYSCSTINISSIEIQLHRKNVKNINFSICASNGQVRVSAPVDLSEKQLRSAINSKLNWIRKKIQINNYHVKKCDRNYHSGETIYYFGQPYALKVIEQVGKPSISIQTPDILEMCVQENTDSIKRAKLLNEWYRAELKQRIPRLIEKWQPTIGRKVSKWGVKQMKTRWGSCNINKKRIWLNLELAKRTEECLEYVVVHEMTHLLERNHSERFKKLLDGFIPEWKNIEAKLNSNLVKR